MTKFTKHIDGLVQDCSISSALAMEILQFCTKASIKQLSLKPSAYWCQITSRCNFNSQIRDNQILVLYDRLLQTLWKLLGLLPHALRTDLVVIKFNSLFRTAEDPGSLILLISNTIIHKSFTSPTHILSFISQCPRTGKFCGICCCDLKWVGSTSVVISSELAALIKC